MGDLLIPFAVVFLNGVEKLVIPAKAHKDQELKCPECSNLVVLRRASKDESGTIIRQAHFAHLADSHDSTCSGGTGESQAHKTAKRLVLQSITEWMDGDGPRPSFLFGCDCGQSIQRHFPFTPTFAAAEHRLESGLIPDVFVSDATHRTAIEIFKSHRIEEEKISTYASDLSWWVEVDADLVLEDASWVVIRSSFKRDEFCPRCLEWKLAILNRKYKDLEKTGTSIVDAIEIKRSELSVQYTNLLNNVKRSRSELDNQEKRLIYVRQQIQEVEDGTITAMKMANIESIDMELNRKNSIIHQLEYYIQDLHAKIVAAEGQLENIQDKIRKEPEGTRWCFFWQCLQEARLFGYKPGYPAAKHKEKYGDWPPNHWKDRATSEFAGDIDWQRRVRERS